MSRFPDTRFLGPRTPRSAGLLVHWAKAVKPTAPANPVQPDESPFARVDPLARRAMALMFTRVLRARLVIAPVMGSLALTFAFFEPTPWRKLLIRASFATLFTLSFVEFLRYRRFGTGAVNVPFNVWLTITLQLVLISATGGLFSPLLPAVLIMIFLAAVLGERVSLLGMVAISVPAVWALAIVHAFGQPVPSLLPALYGGDAPGLERGPAPWIAVSLFTGMIIVCARVGLLVQKVFEQLYMDTVTARDRALSVHADQNRTMTLLSSEIAHELKNPLASLKGLGALIAKDVEGRTAERVKVLRREVDRMQGILEEFLTFSRPLVPLSLDEHELSELARDVARLHEASARERAVNLTVDAPGPVSVHCDARKVRQVLINLVQNALDAAPHGSDITLSVRRTDEGARVSVTDQGPGLPPEIEERVFEPFVTSKEHGSGIGLVVARSLARQHGGELTLGPGADRRGVIAVVSLPARPPHGVAEAPSPDDHRLERAEHGVSP